ncbi:hypothetical protein DSO57_1032336 [Entomophthora muscae]|uniref:Uncharacterized protein n=1 Tax=Entomophthora muscae TaxID=34485 RepID=A0ACC2TZ08_9FUNG|nr:hypothetical protein DSO57_1032336 [Entomophthora muscae]
MPIDREKVLVGLPTYSKHSNTLLLDTDCQPPIYRSTWCPLSTKPSIASLPAYEQRYHQSLRHIPPRKSSRPHLARVPILY